MARIQVPELVAAITARYNIKGERGPDTLSPEVVPVSVVDILDQPEKFRRSIGHNEITGATGVCLGIRVIPGTGLYIIVDLVQFSLDTPGTVRAYKNGTALTGAVTYGEYADGRLAGKPGAQLRKQDATAPGGAPLTIAAWRLATNTIVRLEGPIVLDGTNFDQLSLCFAAAAFGSVTFYWREYAISSEA
jgi:hypothetical protein